jgi:hypothetical protein
MAVPAPLRLDDIVGTIEEFERQLVDGGRRAGTGADKSEIWRS